MDKRTMDKLIEVEEGKDKDKLIEEEEGKDMDKLIEVEEGKGRDKKLWAGFGGKFGGCCGVGYEEREGGGETRDWGES